MRGAASIFESHDFVVEFLPPRPENVRARNYHIDFLSAGFHRMLDFGNTFFKGRKPSGKTSRDGSDGNAAALQSLNRCLDKLVIYANGADANIQFANSQLFKQLILQRLARF